MELARARKIITSTALDDEGSFYGPSENLALGAGLILDGVEFPFFDIDADRFRVRAGLVLVLSHECDLDPENDRFLNDMAVVCPIIPLQALVEDAAASGLTDNELGAFLGNVGRRRVARSVYCPPLPPQLEHGGIVNFNLIASTAVTKLHSGQRIRSLTAFGHRSIWAALEEHLTRAKSETLPLAGATVLRGRSIVG